MTDLKRASQLKAGNIVKLEGSRLQWRVIYYEHRFHPGMPHSGNLTLRHEDQLMHWYYLDPVGNEPIWETVDEDEQIVCRQCQTAFDVAGKIRFEGFTSNYYTCPKCEARVYVPRKGQVE